MLTSKQIKVWIEEHNDFFGFRAEAAIEFLDYEDAKELLKEGVTKEDWDRDTLKLTHENVVEAMREYMERIGWPKVINHRGISAGRTIQKMTAWLTILEDGEMVAFADDDDNYPQYGAPILKKICEKYGFPIPDDEGVRRMARGKPCQMEFECGCGR